MNRRKFIEQGVTAAVAVVVAPLASMAGEKICPSQATEAPPATSKWINPTRPRLAFQPPFTEGQVFPELRKINPPIPEHTIRRIMAGPPPNL